MTHNTVNMFTAKKIKLHGMQSSKWTTSDKIIQYKGLINLYTRDRKIIELDTNIARKKTLRELDDLAKSVHTDRRELDNAIKGDKQALRNTLSEHKELQLAYQNAQPKKVIDEIDQLNFNKRKVLDKLRYNKLIKSQKLIDLKLEQSVLEDRLKYVDLGQIKQEKIAQIITGKVQDAILRREAASRISSIYRDILDIMKRDALYFDVIIATVQNDGYAQSKCFLGATKLGQLATEYLDDRRQEYDTLEKIILKDMATRKVDIKILNEQIDNATASIKQLLRKDSDITTCMIKVKDTPSLESIKKDVSQIEKTLNFLKDTTLVPSFDSIYPCLQEQARQKRRLRHLEKKCAFDKNILLNKANHAELMSSVLKNTANEEIVNYKATKQELLQSIEKTKEDIQNSQKIIRFKRDTHAKIRIALNQLLLISYGIKTPAEGRKKSSNVLNTRPGLENEKSRKMELPKEDEIDVSKIIATLVQKFTILMSAYNAKRAAEAKTEVYKSFENLMQERMILAGKAEGNISTTSLLQGLYTEASHQLTREDIKKQSQEIVAANTKNEDLVPVFQVATKKKFKFNKK